MASSFAEAAAKAAALSAPPSGEHDLAAIGSNTDEGRSSDVTAQVDALNTQSQGQAFWPSAHATSSTEPSVDHRIKHLILDASPLLTQAPVQALKAQRIYIPPQVVAELRDPKARAHLDWLKLSGQEVVIREGGPEAMLKVIAFAKKTGDYAVLSHADLSVLALTYALEAEEHGTWRIRDEIGGATGQQKHEAEKVEQLRKEGKLPPAREGKSHGKGKGKRAEAETRNPATESHVPAASQEAAPEPETTQPPPADAADRVHSSSKDCIAAGYDTGEANQATGPSNATDVAEEDPSDEEDDGGEWINAENLTEHRNLALGIVTQESKLSKDEAQRLNAGEEPASANSKGRSKAKKPPRPMSVACITSDYAVQNVMLQMGLALISMSGQRITQVKSWVLRCHACTKICKDQERKFCPSCGNPTLLRTSVTSMAPGAGVGSSAVSGSAASMGLQVHLKQHFQYKNRGTVYPLPAPKPSSSSALKQQPARGGVKHKPVPILREDQVEWQRAVAHEKVRKEKQERAMLKAIEKSGGRKDAFSARFDDPDWMPDMLLTSGKGRRAAGDGLPALGLGRKNPNERKGPRR
ncbi:hypothetical protein K437DRAFT_241343 [Tilletiaria anomala UBC 951]|uniref:20S-pre-rRNA D-site endonuclease NOB1 n=1 Tax=Tilletiaria anomala (strain ATCC 24038 / CBS 436.72 / UBC 951) TaxID=1037660 RepID=A0A066VC16_TILAU|nr:uncharacterized protein K437DRAFT_241343 [Tilletiaria anomala UBC 951]KDN36140.1 hypothetical protein K437DRAFT_241343 [Tilletiaria anomala UBC 951]